MMVETGGLMIIDFRGQLSIIVHPSSPLFRYCKYIMRWIKIDAKNG